MLEVSGIIGSVSVTMTGAQYFPMQNMNEQVLKELKSLAVEEKDLNNK